ncbi:MAG: GreA/GreB family elongation factor [Opitutaceae bacterium]
MSKAFLREDDLQEDSPPLPAYPAVPFGQKNFLTGSGATRLQAELAALAEKRAFLSARARDPEVRWEVQGIDHRIRHLRQSLRTAEVVPPELEETDTVRFGATVTVRDGHGADARYRIVGVDETDFERGDVSWLSPMARALLNATKGQHVRVKTPRGENDLEIVSIVYDPAPGPASDVQLRETL